MKLYNNGAKTWLKQIDAYSKAIAKKVYVIWTYSIFQFIAI